MNFGKINWQNITENLKKWAIPIILGIIIISFYKYILVGISNVFIDQYWVQFSTDNSSSINTGIIGDTYGGTTGPTIALIASFLTFIAFWAQFLANREVNRQFKVQQFENQFFEMLRLHKENVNEMKIVGYGKTIQKTYQRGEVVISEIQNERLVEGRKVFVTMAKELIACYEFCKAYDKYEQYEKKDLLKLAYRIFFFGSASDLISLEKIDKKFIRNLKNYLFEIRNKHKKTIGENNEFNLNGKKIKLHVKYNPFTGHENRLGHYYRHLYSTVRYVVDKEKEGLFN